MGIFVVYIGIIGSLFHVDLKISLVIIIINFNGIKKMARLAMLVIFHVNVIICQFFNFSIYHTFIASLLKKIIF
jgi:hypothetical protein